jgi:hypothetical protein
MSDAIEMPPLPATGYALLDVREIKWSKEDAIEHAKKLEGYKQGFIVAIKIEFTADGAPALAGSEP